MLWDILGQKSDDALHSAYYKGANGALLVCDVTRTADGRAPWQMEGESSSMPRQALRSSSWRTRRTSDQRSRLDKLESMAGILGGKMVMTSAKTGEGVEGASSHWEEP